MANEFKIKKGLIVNGSGSTILDIQGSQGQLLTVTDSSSGSILSVKSLTGSPILQVSSDDSVKLGTFNAEAIKVSGSNATITGSLFGTSSYTLSASYAANSVSASNSLTASYINPLVQNVTITGSFLVSGSTTQIGNNNLQGTTTLSGSINISGNTAITGSITALNQTASFGYVSASFLDITGKQVVRGYTQYLPTSDVVPISTVGGYVYSSGSQGDLYFAQTNGSVNNVTRLRWIEGNMYSGLLNGAVISTASSTAYNVSSGSGIIVTINGSLSSDPYPAVQYISWGNLSASIAPLSASYDQSFIAIEPSGSSGIIHVSGIPYNDGQFNTLIPIGNVIHQNRSTINATATYPSVAYGYKQRTNDFIRAFGPLKLSGLNTYVSGSSTGSLIVASGTAYSDGRNYTTDPDNPSYITDPGTTISKIYRYRQSGSAWVYDTNGGAGYGAIDPTRYSLNGVLTAVPGTGANRRWSIQRVYFFPAGATKGIYVYYGNETYATQVEATANIPFEDFIEAPNTAAGAVLSAYIVVRNDANFTDTASYNIQQGGLFRNVGGSGGGGSAVTQTLTGLSDVSITSPTNGQPLAYNSTTLKWENLSSITSNLVGTASYATTASYLLGGVVSASYAATSSYSTNISGSINYVSKFTGANTLGNSLIYDNGTNVGIGTVSPAAKLEVNDGIAWLRTTGGTLDLGYSTDAVPRVRLQRDLVGAAGGIVFTAGTAAATSGTAITQNGSGNLVLLTSNGTALTERVRITSAGNVGIGTTAPVSKLHVEDSTLAGSGALSGSAVTIVQNFSTSAIPAMVKLTGTQTGPGFKFVEGRQNGSLTFSVGHTGDVFGQDFSGRNFNGTFTSNTNNSGAGSFNYLQTITSTANQKVVNILPTYNQTSGGATNTDIFLNRTTTAVGSGSQYLMDLQHNGASKFNVTPSGSVGIGTSTPNAKLDVSGSAIISGSLTVTQGITGSLFGTASWANNALTASNISPAISNNTDNYLLTATGNGTVNGESLLQFDGQKLSVLYQAGDEGGEILLGKPATNNTLTGSGVTIDIWQNRLRFFEQGGAARGAYIDLTAAASGVGTNLIATSGGGTVTQVDTTGNVNGITLTGGPITTSGTITLGGTLSNIQSSQLATSSLMIGNSSIALGATGSSLAGLTSVTATSFTGSLFGTSSYAVSASFLSSTTNAFLQGGNSFGTTALLGTNDNQSLAFETSGSERMRITSAGSVGIGTTAPSASLHVNFNGSSTSGIILENTANTLNHIIFSRSNSVYGRFGINASTGEFRWDSTPSYFPTIYSNGVERMRIDTSGNVGIGTTAPSTKLHIERSTNGELLRLRDTTNSNQDYVFETESSGTFYGLNIKNNNTGLSLLNISADQKIGIATNDPLSTLHVNKSAADTYQVLIGSSNGLGLGSDAGGQQRHIIGSAYGNAATKLSFTLGGFTTASDKMTILGSGNVGIGTTAPSAPLTIQGAASLDTVSTGSELTTTATGTNWSGTDFTTGYTHATGSITALTSTFSPSIGSYYYIAITVTGRTAGNVTTNFAGWNDYYRTSGTGTLYIRATSTDLNCVPTTDFDGKIVISVKTFGTLSSISTINNSAGTATLETRIGGGGTNTHIGSNAGTRTVGTNNTGFGNQALSVNTGNYNTGIGHVALSNIAGANYNTAVGYNVFGSSPFTIANTYNVGVGGNIGGASSTGGGNTYAGFNIARSSTSAANNVAMGYSALSAAITAGNNVAIGYNSLSAATSGGNNTAVGLSAGGVLTTGDTSVFLGASTTALTNGSSNEIVIGYNATGLGSNSVVLGNASIATTALRGNVGIGTTAPLSALDVRVSDGNVRVGAVGNYSSLEWNNSSGYTAINTSGSQNWPIHFRQNSQTRMTVGGTTGYIGIGTTTPNAKLDVNGNAIVTGSLTVTAGITGSLFGTASWAQNVTTATSALSASNFVITSTLQLDGSLTDYATVASTIVGDNNLYTQNTGSYTSAFVKYTVSNGANVRAGQFMTAWSGSTTIYTDTSTGDLGNTSGIVFSSAIVTGQVQVNATAATSGWKIKTLATFI